MSSPKEFWITNSSNRNVSLSDLYLTVKAYTSVNLLDKKHYYYTWEQILKSVTQGSIFKKRDKIHVRKIPPKLEKKVMLVASNSFIPSREKSIFEIKEEKYEELEISDEDFAEENSDLLVNKETS